MTAKSPRKQAGKHCFLDAQALLCEHARLRHYRPDATTVLELVLTARPLFLDLFVPLLRAMAQACILPCYVELVFDI